MRITGSRTSRQASVGPRLGRHGLGPALVGRLAHILNLLQSMDNGVLIERRVADLEDRVADVKVRVNGHARPVGRRL